MLGGFVFVRNWGNHSGGNQAEMAAVSDQAMKILKIGLGDHVRCAIGHKFAERVLSSEQMANLLGERYAGMASIIKASAPAGYQLTAAHQCKVDGRTFAHLIIKKPEGFVSLIFTRKQGESYPSEASQSTFESFGVKLHQARLDGFEVAGFETKQHLGFFVSGLGQQGNLQIASRLAPPLQRYLSSLEI
jgi:hypothetical protein